MDITEKMQNAINEQIREELNSAYIYLSMAAYCENRGLPGFAHWMRVQSQEELEHAMKFFEYVHDRGGRVVLEALQAPPVDFGSPLGVFEKALEHEQHITRCIHDLYTMAVGENDYASLGLLQWFVDEQVEEEKNASEIVTLLRMVGDKGHALIMLDRQLAARAD